jgi:hypothetical protein
MYTMTFDELLTALGYQGSPHFLRRGDGRYESEPGYGHIFRRGEDNAKGHKRWRVEGVYGLRDINLTPERFVPVVYVCSAEDELAAHDLHRLVWNQDVVPYVLVHEPKGLRVYAGFHYNAKGKTDAQQGVLRALTDFDRAQSIIDAFDSKTVDEGKIWQNPQLKVDPSRRVYHHLLRNLRELDKWLRGAGGLKKEISHALIGKYVYLRYLRDRGILSDERLARWGILEQEIFGRHASLDGLQRLTRELENWLNGRIFPMSFSGPNAPGIEHIERVAATFMGDDMGGQLHLDFKAYNFSYIPIETLSLIYEQFLHADDDDDDTKAITKKKTKGRRAGAYYTPLPLVNFMLAELQGLRRLKVGMKVCDPSCGSGAFLVQAYRLLIENTYPASGKRPKPTDLRRLLQTSIFGVDVDGDACQVTQLSLLLTLLDYVNPPDLTGANSAFKLPSLLDTKNPNIFKGNFFGVETKLRGTLGKGGFDWIVGNPPWKQLKGNDHGDDDQAVWDWMGTNLASPVGMYQVAQAFAWEVPRYLAADGECALLVPAMSLFEERSRAFRKNFFRYFQVHTVANFANLAEVLFDGRSRVPAAALFYRHRPDRDLAEPTEPTTIYSPFVVNQEATPSLSEGERPKLWNLVVNTSEVRTLELDELSSGSGLPWKLAMWGTPWDERLIRRLEKKWPSLESLEAKWHPGEKEKRFICRDPSQIFCVSEGLQLRLEDGDDIEPVNEVAGQLALDVDVLAKWRNLFAFPVASLKKLDASVSYYARKGRAKGPLAVSNPPHVIVSAARNFAIYSEEFIVVPPRQIGIISTTDNSRLLKALSLFLSSDFAFYHQFIRATELGIKRDRATLEALRQLPVPLAELSTVDLKEWADLHAELENCPPRPLHPVAEEAGQGELNFLEDTQGQMVQLLGKLNNLTAQVLGLDDRERALVHDLVRVRFQLNDGKRGHQAIRQPTESELRTYAGRLKQELDDFVGDDAGRLHRVTVVREEDSAMVEVDFTHDHAAAQEVVLLLGSSGEARRLRETREKLLQKRAQWVYFNRNLRIYRGHQTYLLKPLQRFHWTESAAMMDASDLIAETVGDGGLT